MQIELSQFAVITQGHVQAAKAQFNAALIQTPDGFILHAKGLPQGFGRILGNRFAGGLFQHPAKNLGVRADIVKNLSGRTCSGQVCNDITHSLAKQESAVEQHVDVGKLFVVNLTELNAAGHTQQIADRDFSPGGAVEFTDILLDRIIQTGNVTVLQGNSGERADHRFGH